MPEKTRCSGVQRGRHCEVEDAVVDNKLLRVGLGFFKLNGYIANEAKVIFGYVRINAIGAGPPT